MSVNPNEIISEYFHRMNAGHEPTDIVGGVVDAIMDTTNDINHREFHLASVLYSNPSPSIEFIIALVRAVLRSDQCFEKDKIALSARNNKNVVSVAGSGKKGIKTINISTPSAIVAASLGAQVVKHSSRATSSLSGSSDFFTEVGGQILDTAETVRVFDKTDLGLFSIEGTVPKFDALYGGRVLAPTALSYALPAAISPVSTDALVYGFSMPRVKDSLRVLHGLGFRNTMVINSTDDEVRYIDEAGLFKKNSVAYSPKNEVSCDILITDPFDVLALDMRRSIDWIMQKSDRKENVHAGVAVLRGRGNSVQSEVVALNASLILFQAGLCEDIREGFEQALREISSGRPYEKLKQVVSASGGNLNI